MLIRSILRENVRMWSKNSQARWRRDTRERKPYRGVLGDKKWAHIPPLLPTHRRGDVSPPGGSAGKSVSPHLKLIAHKRHVAHFVPTPDSSNLTKWILGRAFIDGQACSAFSNCPHLSWSAPPTATRTSTGKKIFGLSFSTIPQGYQTASRTACLNPS
jgi:hypothetical protein